MGQVRSRASNVPLTDWELWACANETMQQHGEDAGTYAAMKADNLEIAGDFEGAKAWREIMRRIDQLLAQPETKQ